MVEVTAEECRAKALELRGMAERCGNLDERAMIFRMAVDWQNLALSKEAVEQRTAAIILGVDWSTRRSR